MPTCSCGQVFPTRASLAQHRRRNPEQHAVVFDNNEPAGSQDTAAAHAESARNFDGTSSANGTIHNEPASSSIAEDWSTEYPNADCLEDDFDVLPSGQEPTNHSDSESDDLSKSSLSSSDRPPDPYLVDKFDQYSSSGYGHMVASKQYESDVNLMGILKKANAPIYLFDELKDWARASIITDVSFTDKNSKKRAAVLTEMRRRFDMDRVQPQTTQALLPGSQQTIKITMYDFKEQLYSLLSDPAVMRNENLIFPEDDAGNMDPFASPKNPKDLTDDDLIFDVIDGSAYYEVHKVKCVVHGRDVVVGVMFFIDKAHYDVQGRLCFEPVTFTLSIFRKEVRTNPVFWRTLGFIANQANISCGTAKLKSQDYHFMISLLFKSVVAVQDGPGLMWNLKYNERTYPVVFKFPVLFVVGDTEGHDKLCGKFLSRTQKIARLCRYCDCPTSSTCDTTKRWSYTKGPVIADLVKRGQTDRLRSMAYHCVKNGFDGVHFADPERGINGATLAEVLHVWQHGLFPRALGALFGTKRALKCAYRQFCSLDHPN